MGGLCLLKNQAVILFDAAYEAFVSDSELPRSIYAVEGAKQCAIEFCSLSKTAGFTGTRCGYTIVPKELVFTASTGEEMSLNAMWNRRQCTKYNGTSYIVQKAAAAVFSEERHPSVPGEFGILSGECASHYGYTFRPWYPVLWRGTFPVCLV